MINESKNAASYTLTKWIFQRQNFLSTLNVAKLRTGKPLIPLMSWLSGVCFASVLDMLCQEKGWQRVQHEKTSILFSVLLCTLQKCKISTGYLLVGILTIKLSNKAKPLFKARWISWVLHLCLIYFTKLMLPIKKKCFSFLLALVSEVDEKSRSVKKKTKGNRTGKKKIFFKWPNIFQHPPVQQDLYSYLTHHL